MTEWLFGLTVGAGLILLVNLALIRFMGVSAKYAAAVVALVTIGLYGPYSIVRWPGGDVFAIHLGIYLLVSLACGMLLGARSQGEGMHWGPAVIGGFFIFVVVSGAVFVTVAERGLTPSLRDWLLPAAHSGREVSSLFPGVISHDFQQKEELYNQYLQQVERQRQRGWQVQKGWLSDPMINEPAVFRVVVRTREDQPMTGATVVGQFLRPSNSKQDIAFTLAETDPGVYESKLLLPLAGHWNLVLEIRKGDDLHEIRAVTQVSDR